VWISSAPEWELIASKLIIADGVRRYATIAEMIAEFGGLCRIEIDRTKVRSIPPGTLIPALRIAKNTMKRLVMVAKEQGSKPSEWWAVAGPVPTSAFLKIEVATECDPLKWVEVSKVERGDA
jgi:hypothetical protein